MKRKAVVNKNNSKPEKKDAPSIYEIFHKLKEINSYIKGEMVFIQEENQLVPKELDNLNNVKVPNKDIETNKLEESKDNKNLNIDSNIVKNEDIEVINKIHSSNIINDSKEIKIINKDLKKEKNEESKVKKKLNVLI